MRVIVYGVGKRYGELCGEFEKNKIEIAGICDSKISVWGRKIVCGESIYEVRNIDEFPEDGYDYVVVTTEKYYEEIRDQLTDKGFQRDRILLAEALFYDISMGRLYHIELFRDKLGLEVGGPSDMFSYIYGKCAGCDLSLIHI